jgi:ribonuclease H2 subunit A
VYVDALGATGPYEKLLSSHFPGINFTVTAKADSKYKIVGAASVAAKVTRDAWIGGWVFEEDAPSVMRTWSNEVGSGYPSGTYVGLPCRRQELKCVCGRPKHENVGQRFP